MSKLGLIVQAGLYGASILGGMAVGKTIIHSNYKELSSSIDIATDNTKSVAYRTAAGVNAATTIAGAAAAGVGAAGLISYGFLCTGFYGACIEAAAKPMLKPIAKAVTKIL